MRTTLTLDDDVAALLEQQAAAPGVSLADPGAEYGRQGCRRRPQRVDETSMRRRRRRRAPLRGFSRLYPVNEDENGKNRKERQVMDWTLPESHLYRKPLRGGC